MSKKTPLRWSDGTTGTRTGDNTANVLAEMVSELLPRPGESHMLGAMLVGALLVPPEGGEGEWRFGHYLNGKLEATPEELFDDFAEAVKS